MPSELGINFRAAPTVARYMRSDTRYRLIMGPVGSGKSSGSVMELLKRAMATPKGPDGIRRSRWAVIRNTYPQLRDTTIKTFKEWVPSSLGTWHEAQGIFHARFGDCDMEVLFRALDRPGDIQKLLSLELTGAWINEAREIELAVFNMLRARIGRYPAIKDVPEYWYGIWMDTNAPDTDSWLYRMFFEEPDSDFEVFVQPGGLEPNAENIDFLPKDYYQNMMSKQTLDWINVYVNNKPGFAIDGKPVYPEFKSHIHVVDNLPELPPQFPLLIGCDFGLCPAAAIGQIDSDGQVQILDEVVVTNAGAIHFAQELNTKVRGIYRQHHVIRGTGDPAGMQRSQVNEQTVYDVLHAAGLPIDPCFTNDWLVRRDTIGALLLRLTMRGRPALVIHRRAKTLVKAMAGGYCLRRLQVPGRERFADVPDKGPFSHVAEGLQYLAVGEGLDREVLNGTPGRPVTPVPVRLSNGRIKQSGARRQ